MDAWWFEPKDGVLRFGDGRKPVAGKTHRVKCDPVLCADGLHGSVRLIDALPHAESPIVWRVRLGGTIAHGEDKCAATERTYIQKIDIEQTLFDFARWSALQVIHLWDAPPVVREFLETGDDLLRVAAGAAARAAAGAAARAAAGAAARAAAWGAAGAAAWTAAGAAAWAAAGAAVLDAAWDKQNAELERRVTVLMDALAAKGGLMDGKGCECFARCEADCVCDADWTPVEVTRLQTEVTRLRAENKMLREALEDLRYACTDKAMAMEDAALAAKGE